MMCESLAPKCIIILRAWRRMRLYKLTCSLPVPTRCKHKMGQWNSHVTLTKVSIVTTIYHTPARYSILHTPCPIAHNIIGPASAPLTLHIAMFSTISVNSRHAFAASSEWLRSVFQG